jgi:hypothetical protein
VFAIRFMFSASFGSGGKMLPQAWLKFNRTRQKGGSADGEIATNPPHKYISESLGRGVAIEI